MHLKKLVAFISCIALLLPAIFSCGEAERYSNYVPQEVVQQVPRCSYCNSTDHADGACAQDFIYSASTRKYCSICGATDHINYSCSQFITSSLKTPSTFNICQICGIPSSPSHSHSKCRVCKNDSHIIHPICPICQNNDHVDGDCKVCEFCMTDAHTTVNHPECSICKKQTKHFTDTHPKCKKCGAKHQEADNKCPNYCSKCKSYHTGNCKPAPAKAETTPTPQPQQPQQPQQQPQVQPQPQPEPAKPAVKCSFCNGPHTEDLCPDPYTKCPKCGMRTYIKGYFCENCYYK